MQWTNKHKIFFAITVVIVILALSLFNWKRRKIWNGGIGLLFWYLFLPLLSPSSSERQKKCHLGIDKRPKKAYLYAVFWDRHIAGWSSPVARQAHNLKVNGSIPFPATIERLCRSCDRFFCMLSLCVVSATFLFREWAFFIFKSSHTILESIKNY